MRLLGQIGTHALTSKQHPSDQISRVVDLVAAAQRSLPCNSIPQSMHPFHRRKGLHGAKESQRLTGGWGWNISSSSSSSLASNSSKTRQQYVKRLRARNLADIIRRVRRQQRTCDTIDVWLPSRAGPSRTGGRSVRPRPTTSRTAPIARQSRFVPGIC